MSIFNQPTGITVEKIAQTIKNNNSTLLSAMKGSVTRSFNLVWNNSAFTPQEIINTFGTDAGQLFQASSDIQTLIMKYDQTFVPLIPSNPVTFNNDGTVTVN